MLKTNFEVVTSGFFKAQQGNNFWGEKVNDPFILDYPIKKKKQIKNVETTCRIRKTQYLL